MFMTNRSPVYALCLALIIIAPAVAVNAAPGESGGGSGTLGPGDPTVEVLETTVDFEDFAFGDNTEDVSNFIHVATNYDIELQASGTNDGKMSVGSNELSNALKVGIGTFPPTAISGSETPVSYQIDAGTNSNFDGKFVQKVVPADPVADGYTITVTFTAVEA